MVGLEIVGGEGDKGKVEVGLGIGDAEVVGGVPFVLAKLLARRSAAAKASLRADDIAGLATPVGSLPLTTGAAVGTAGESNGEILPLALLSVTLTSGVPFALNFVRIFSSLSSKFNTFFV